MSHTATAGILLIGNELLSGRVRDENLSFLAGELWQLGVPVRRTVVVRDAVEEIAAAVRELAARETYVFTSGGVGPTHDDVTIAGVAAAFGVPVVLEPGLERLLRGFFGERTTPFHLRMARVPQGAELLGGDGRNWPTVRMRNVIVLPGVPEYLRRRFVRLRELFRHEPLHRCMLALAADEPTIAPYLEAAVAENAGVEIGSYPQGDTVLVTFEGTDSEQVERAREAVDRALANVCERTWPAGPAGKP
ncbi:MAG: competence/damage-inducible protein A [Acidobacteria bacterium]|nr:competence/damage-inducible protein A [Acidobacteriota bacterium]